jgi:hypothetical protein
MKNLTITPKLHYILLFMILFFGLGYRLYGIFWGVHFINPYNSYNHPDELKIVWYARNFPEVFYTNQDFRYPTFLHHVLSIAVLPLSNLKSGEIQDRLLYLDTVMIIGRLLSIISGIGAVFLTYLVSKKIYDRNMALLAASLLCFSMLHITNSSFITTDVTTSFFLILFVFLIIKAFEEKTRCPFIGAGITLGLLIGTKYTGALAVIILPVYIYFYDIYPKSDTSLIHRLKVVIRNSNYWIMLLFALLFFLVTTPGILIYPDKLVESLNFETSRLAQKRISLSNIEVWETQYSFIVRAIGWPLTITFLAGMLYAALRKVALEWAGILLFIVFSLYFGNSPFTRYYIFLLPYVAIFAGLLLTSLLHVQMRTIHLLGIILTVFVLGYSIYYSTAGILSRYPDTRTQAAEYIRKNIPIGSTIGLGYQSPIYKLVHPWKFPYINFNDLYIYKEFLEKPDYIVLSSDSYNQIYEVLEEGILNPDFSLPEEYHKDWYRYSPPSPEMFRFYSSIMKSGGSEYELIKEYQPRIFAPIEFSSPEIKIYKKN